MNLKNNFLNLNHLKLLDGLSICLALVLGATGVGGLRNPELISPELHPWLALSLGGVISMIQFFALKQDLKTNSEEIGQREKILRRKAALSFLGLSLLTGLSAQTHFLPFFAHQLSVGLFFFFSLKVALKTFMSRKK